MISAAAVQRSWLAFALVTTLTMIPCAAIALHVSGLSLALDGRTPFLPQAAGMVLAVGAMYCIAESRWIAATF